MRPQKEKPPAPGMLGGDRIQGAEIGGGGQPGVSLPQGDPAWRAAARVTVQQGSAAGGASEVSTARQVNAAGECGRAHSPTPHPADRSFSASGAGENGQSGGEASGLVSPPTSGTRFLVDSKTARLKRMRRATLTAANEVQRRTLPGFRPPRAVGVTLTYRPGVEWSQRHISDFIACVRKWADRRGIEAPYVWVAELQKRGAVHYHAIFWVPRNLSMPKPDKQGWWRHGMTRIEQLRSGAAYASKYASKGDGVMQFPKGLRLHGRGGLDASERMAVRWWCLAKWVRDFFGECVRDVVKVVGGYASRGDGEYLESPWRVTFDGGQVWAYRIA
jgi:hypothetical protein